MKRIDLSKYETETLAHLVADEMLRVCTILPNPTYMGLLALLNKLTSHLTQIEKQEALK